MHPEHALKGQYGQTILLRVDRLKVSQQTSQLISYLLQEAWFYPDDDGAGRKRL